MLPAYIPNPAAALFGGGTPIDMGRSCRDGYRVFGDGKTWRGLILGVLAGILTGLVMIWAREFYGLSFLPSLTPLVVFLLSLGALLGDLVKSYFKRRLGKSPGDKWPVADQYDLVAGAFLMVALFDPAWIMGALNAWILLTILIVTPVLHRFVNYIGFWVGVKKVPW
ncbi:MAG: CDP-2,3-bis-(O-geranylgeranyl)-sn-glycerol synthase [Methanoregulaceae archaeon]|nr:CDP-2,3-bis-(O-geranylgeranyl)-sn-glycerol synthase [Methanoregulaceae archaeon]